MNKTNKILLSFFLILISGMGYSQSVPSYVPTNGLVGWWGFNGNAQDVSGNGNHGTVNGATLTTDRFGNQNAAYDFDGVDDWIQVQDHVSLRPNHITMSAWFNLANLNGSYSIITKTNTQNASGEQYILGVDFLYNWKPNFQIKQGSNCQPGYNWQRLILNTSYSQNNWYHIVCTYDGTTLKIFQNGQLNSTNLVLNGVIDNCQGGSLNFGTFWANCCFIDGKLDDIGIWNRALSQQEINSLYNSQLSQPCTTSVTTNLNVIGCGFAVLSNGDTVNQSGTYLDTLTTILGCDSILSHIVTIQPSSICNPIPAYVPTNGLMGWWGFNGNAQDGSGNGNHGTVNGATLITDRFGNQNKAYEFDGTDDYISVNNSSSLSLSQYSISLWSKIDTLISWIPGRVLISKGCEWPIGVGVSYRIYFENTYYVMDNWAPSRSLLSNLNNSFNSNWSHLVFTYDGQGNSMYINGVLLGNATQNSALVSSLEPLFIGARKFASSCTISDNYSGKLDDIGIWNRALTPQEITNLYNSQLPTQTSLCLPTITTSSPSSVGVDSVVIGGDISNDGGSSIVLRGICYSTSPNPNMGNQRTEDGSGMGSFNTVLRGLISSTTYYARSYAKNSIGVVVYGNEVSFTTTASLPGLRCPGTPTVTDIDGNVYNTVQIGNQCWTQSNLKVSKYRNGDTIPTGLSNSVWENTTSGAYAIYNNDPVNDGLYGKLYNHYAVTDSRGICPTGWHVPTDGEWTSLENHLGGSGVAGGKMKSTDFYPAPGGWFTYHYSWLTTNSSGFTGLPGGTINNPSSSNSIGTNGFWWSYTTTSNGLGWSRCLVHNGEGIIRNSYYPFIGFSVRCLKNTLPQVNTSSVTNVTPSTALVTGEVISEGDQNTTRGFCYSTTSNPTLSNDTTMNGTDIGAYSDTLQNLTPSTTYYVRAYATNSVGTSYGNELNFSTTAAPSFTCGTSTVSDVDNNTYNTVQIGTQCWTQSNLKTSRYRNGDSIPTGLSNSAWSSTMAGAYSIYNNDPVNDGLYGKLYNHYAVTDSRGLCPTGWHVPSDGEWTSLENHLGGSGVAGGALKSTATHPTPGGWNSPNTGATNSSGFTALPGGLRDVNGDFSGRTGYGHWWSSSVSPWSSAWCRALSFNAGGIGSGGFERTWGFSVRCLKNTLPQVNTSSVWGVTDSSALVLGKIISEGDQNTTRGFCYSTTSNPTVSNDTTMNGIGFGVYSDTLQNLTRLTPYYVRAYAMNSVGTAYGTELIIITDSIPGLRCPGNPTVTDIDGNDYHTVQIGNQCWTQSNLKVSKYRNGDSITTGLSNSAWQNTTLGAYAIYNNDFVNDGLYGKLYNHYAVTDSRGLCPTGWHVPSDAEWTTLENHLGASSVEGGALKSTATHPTPGGWNSPNTGATNSSGFTALPGGGKNVNGDFIALSTYGVWWSSSVTSGSGAWLRDLYYIASDITRYDYNRTSGFSVRCLKD